jgi:hypothetical protein
MTKPDASLAAEPIQTWAQYLEKELIDQRLSRRKFILAARKKHETFAAAGRALGLKPSRIWRIIKDAQLSESLALEMAQDGYRPWKWRSNLTESQREHYRILVRDGASAGDALMSMGRLDLLEQADPIQWSRLQAKIKDRKNE